MPGSTTARPVDAVSKQSSERHPAISDGAPAVPSRTCLTFTSIIALACGGPRTPLTIPARVADLAPEVAPPVTPAAPVIVAAPMVGVDPKAIAAAKTAVVAKHGEAQRARIVAATRIC